MTWLLLLVGVVIFCAILLNKISNKIGVPVLLGFIFLGMIFGSDGIFKIPFDDYSLVSDVCSGALIIIMFYGGFGTNWKTARGMAPKSALLATVGVAATALLTGGFCYLVLKLEWSLSFMIGAVISSTDAASVFSILRRKQLNLRFNTASLLELESGSNDPFAYMLTLVAIMIRRGKGDLGGILELVISQVGLGILMGFFVAFIGRWLLRQVNMGQPGMDMVFIVGIAIIAYALPAVMSGNGYLSTYIAGIVLGNSEFPGKKNIVKFFDGVTNLIEILIFFLLGLLSAPSRLICVALPAISICLFLTFVARPLSVFALMAPLKMNKKQTLLVSFAGLRGAAAIVFAILPMYGHNMGTYVFDVTFFIVIFSILIQGSLLPNVAEKLNMIDNSSDVMKSFTDYTEEVPVQFVEFTVPIKHSWVGKTLQEIELPPETLVVLIVRAGKDIIPNGNTVITALDKLILSALSSQRESKKMKLSEIIVTEENGYENKLISELVFDKGTLIILVKRGDEALIPSGNDVLKLGDILVISHIGNKKL